MSLFKGSTIFECMKEAENYLLSQNRPDASIDTKLLMKHILGFDDTKLLLERTKVISEESKLKYEELIQRRAKGIPLQHITLSQEFMGIDFIVSPSVLIPRQDTETLVEEIIEKSKQYGYKTAIDIGTGSGCISISLATYVKDIKICAIDLSLDALEVAKGNVVAHNLCDRIELLKSNVFDSYEGRDKVDLVVSNPPYISKSDVETLMIEVIGHEPRMALTDEGDGLMLYRQISKEAVNYLNKGGMIAYEIGYDQGKAVCDILDKLGYSEIRLLPDLTGKDRVVTARWI